MPCTRIASASPSHGRVRIRSGHRRSSTSPSISQVPRTVRAPTPLESGGSTHPPTGKVSGPSGHRISQALAGRAATEGEEAHRATVRGCGPPITRESHMTDAVTSTFADRHVGPDQAALRRILDVVGVDTAGPSRKRHCRPGSGSGNRDRRRSRCAGRSRSPNTRCWTH